MTGKLNDYLTADEATEELGMSKSTLWRCVRKAGQDKVTEVVFGRRLVKRSGLAAIRRHYAERGSELARQIAKSSGARGGTQKAINARQRAAGNGRASREA